MVFTFFKTSNKVHFVSVDFDKDKINSPEISHTEENLGGVWFEVQGEKGFQMVLDEYWIRQVKYLVKKKIKNKDKWSSAIDFFRRKRQGLNHPYPWIGADKDAEKLSKIYSLNLSDEKESIGKYKSVWHCYKWIFPENM